MIILFLFYALVAGSLIYFAGRPEKAVLSLMNIVIILNPLLGMILGVMFFYNNRDFTEWLLALPIRRRAVFAGQYFGLSLSLALGFAAGLTVPFLIFGVFSPTLVHHFFPMLLTGMALLMIFTALAALIVIHHNDRIKGFGLAILVWLFMALVYDGLILLLLVWFNDYPTEKLALWMSIANPIDLSRIFLMLRLDYSAMMGYTGAVFREFFGTTAGAAISAFFLVVWIVLPLVWYLRKAVKRDF